MIVKSFLAVFLFATLTGQANTAADASDPNDILSTLGLADLSWGEGARDIQQRYKNTIDFPSQHGKANDLLPGRAIRVTLGGCLYDVKLTGRNDRLGIAELFSAREARTQACADEMKVRLKRTLYFQDNSSNGQDRLTSMGQDYSVEYVHFPPPAGTISVRAMSHGEDLLRVK